MQELSAFMDARYIIRSNPNLRILPLFFLISPDDIKNITPYNKKWKQLGICKQTRAKWHHALNALGPNHGLKFAEGDDEVKFRDEIVKKIRHILPKPSPKYRIPCMQGQIQMCQEVADFFNTVQPELLCDDTSRQKNLCSGGNPQAPRSNGRTKNLRTNDSSRPNKPICSDHGQKILAKDVFLSHSGKQKNFVRQLYKDLINQGVSCFFDEDSESLPVGEDFPSRIFEAAKTCKAAILLLSRDFLETKWPMQELLAFVEARDIIRTNPTLKILPLFFLISPDVLKNITPDNEKWKQLGISGEKRAEWHHALNAVRRNNGLKFSEGGDEVKFRDEIVKEIWNLLPTPSPRYHVPCMQGEERMCQEVADFFDTVLPNEKGIRIAGLYGIPGHGKTTLGKAFCNFKLGDFEGKVCYLEFSRGDAFERIKVALQYLTHCPPSHLQTITSQDQAQAELYKRGKSQRVLLVLDNISYESIDEVNYYVEAGFRENSCILLTARSVDVLIKHFKIELQSCMRVPSLEEDEAIRILLERTSIEESTLKATDRAFAAKCAKRCSFKEVGWRGRTFHPLALKAFGGHLFSKYGSQLSKWVAEIKSLEDRSGYGLNDLLAVLGKGFDDMCPEYRTIFLLLTVYMLPNMSPHKVTEWLAINCNKEILFIQKAVEDLCKMSFIEEFGPEIHIHDLYIEFAESKANEMGRWLWWKGDPRSTRGLISSEGTGFELAKLEKCMHRRPSQIAPQDLQNLLLLQLVDVKNMSKLDLSRMGRLRNITLHKCKDLTTIEGMGNLQQLAWLQISNVSPMFKLPELSNLEGLQHIEIDIGISQVLNQLGDLTGCVSMREINICCPSLLEFPRLNGLPHLEKVEFRGCDKVKGPLDCRGCMELQSVVLDSCLQMDSSPLLVGCKKLSKIVLWGCDVTACPEIDVPSALKTMKLLVSSEAASAPKSLESCYGLKNLRLWNMESLKKLPSFRLLSDLTVLELCNCGIRKPPDLRSCVSLKDVSFFKLIYLERFPSFSGLTKLKNLRLHDCWSVQDPPDISGCHQLQVFHLVFNDDMKGLPNMGEFPKLEKIKLSWHSKYEVTYHRKYSHPFEDPSFKNESFQNLSDADMSLQRLEFNVEIVPQSLEGETVPYGLEFDGDLQSFAEMVSQREHFPLSLEFNKDLQFVWSTIEKKPLCEHGSAKS
ncbi:disease resistance protein RPS4B-like [Cryptomeria japonica]|uniref:disease resistance protein RPS4B-like n=1 Tax=Cryptomeria japonica TaxID=3369 RepID=UPI0027DA2BDA|nr:disease resistance protein RPS4B-like [Cryptomeria japonica]